MKALEQAGLAALKRLDPETAHALALRAMALGLGRRPGAHSSARLKTTVAGIALENPLGLAAGFDKNARAINGLSRTGFGFLEVGGATPRPQPGNPRPRLFRLPEDGAVINRFGLNNDGVDAIAERLAKARPAVPVGLNLGANKDSADRAKDYAVVLAKSGRFLDFATVNVSSPNTEKLRDLQGAEALRALLEGVMEARAGLAKPIPIFLKIAPDLSDQDVADIAKTALESGVDAIVATNTTVSRHGLQSGYATEKGGLSGAPLMRMSTQVLARLYRETGGALPLIGVGGIADARDAYLKIRAGASAVQLYTALAYQGLSLVEEICTGLDQMLERDGFNALADAVGVDAKSWV